MKMILENPPAGYKKEAEYRVAGDGEMVLSDTCLHGTDVLQAVRNTMGVNVKKFVVLTPDKPKAEPWDQKTALSAIYNKVWFRYNHRNLASQTIHTGIAATKDCIRLIDDGWLDYKKLAEDYQHCHSQVPDEHTQWYPCTKQGYEESEIPF